MSEFEEFVRRPDVEAALKEISADYFAQIERGEADPTFPDAAEFLRGKGIEPPADARLELKHTIEADSNQVMGPICDDQGTRAYTGDCEWVGGRYHCAWICP